MTPSTYNLTSLVSFDGTNGANPADALIMDSSGNLYGTTEHGGAYNDGTVFEVTSGTITRLASFNGTNGANPAGALIMDSSGNLYGATTTGGASSDGTVFELAKGSGRITRLASFDGTNGANPADALIMDSSGNLYGTAVGGGASSDGTVFELVKGSGKITRLASFNGTNGRSPQGALVMDQSGNLYGTAEWGGAYAQGTVFEVASGSHTIITLGTFTGANDGGPSGVVMDSGGNLYGTTNGSGFNGYTSTPGTVFELARGSRKIAALASFVCLQSPSALIIDGGGNLYGATAYGGASSDGTVFELVKNSGTITTLASFNGTDGTAPYGGLIMDGQGNLYGTTEYGGSAGDGTVFELVNQSGNLVGSPLAANAQMFGTGEKSDAAQPAPIAAKNTLPPAEHLADEAGVAVGRALAASQDQQILHDRILHETALDLAHLIDAALFDLARAASIPK
jgi:uncharacterized repeat protein (TIGR03803 family)